MKTGFPGFSPEAVTFFRGLARNNNREWFQARKEVYERAVKAPLMELVDALNQELVRTAPAYVTAPKAAMYRIYRDTRFSPDKTPYKLHAGALFTRRGFAKNAGAGLYFSVSHKEVEVACGIYMPSPAELLAVRTHVGAHHEELRRLLKNRRLREACGELQGDRLSRVPKGFSVAHPAADLLRYKQYLLYKLLDPSIVTGPELFDEVWTRLKAMIPMVEFLNAPLTVRRRDPLLES